jgi:hypothetical protein
MSHHEVSGNTPVDEKELTNNSRADAIAMLALVVIVVVMAVFYVSY